MHPIEASISEQVHAPRLPRNVLRQLNRQAKEQYYRSGQHPNATDLVKAARPIDAERVLRAEDKRERKNAKRLADATACEIGQRAARECLNLGWSAWL